MKKIIEKHGLKIIGVVILVLTMLTLTRQGQALTKTTIFLYKEISDPLGNKPSSSITTSTIKEVAYQSRGETIYADLWIPKAKNPEVGVVLSLGTDIDRGDQRTLRLAKNLSEAGIVVFSPDIPSLSARRLSDDATVDLVNAFKFLKSDPYLKDKKVGMMGICSSGGLVVLAAENPEISSDLAFLVSINPYYDLHNLYRQLALRKFSDGEDEFTWSPHFKTVEIFNRETIDLLKEATDKEILTDHLLDIENEKIAAGDYPPLADQEKKKLTEESIVAFEALTNRNQDKIENYFKTATPGQFTYLLEMSPSTKIKNHKAKTFIVADLNSTFFPYTQAKDLSNAIENEVYLESKLIEFGPVQEKLTVIGKIEESVKLLPFVYKIFLEIS